MTREGSMTMQRHFVSLAILIAATMPSAFAQEAAPVRPLVVSAKPDAIPDFSGVWVHPYFPGFEPPASGPGPIVNKSRRTRDGVTAGNANQFVGDYANPILKPHAAEIIRKHGAI